MKVEKVKSLAINEDYQALPGFSSLSSGRLDSNQRPLAPHANALPGCATSRNFQTGCKSKIKNSRPKMNSPVNLIFAQFLIDEAAN